MINLPTFGATNIAYGLDANKPVYPLPGDQYIATDTKKSYVCYEKVGFDLSKATYVRSTATKTLRPQGLTFSPDGLQMFEIGQIDSKIFSYRLSSPFDVSSIQPLFTTSKATQEATCTGIFFSPDGLKMFEIGSSGNLIYASNLSASFDISTATFDQSIPTQDTIPTDVFFSDDGLKMFEVGLNSQKIYESNLGFPFDLSTAFFVQSIPTQDTTPHGVFFNPRGTKMFEVGIDSDKIYESVLSLPFDISTATFHQSLPTQDASPRGIYLNPSGSKMFEVGVDSDKIYESTLEVSGEWALMIPVYEDIALKNWNFATPLAEYSERVEITETYADYLEYEIPANVPKQRALVSYSYQVLSPSNIFITKNGVQVTPNLEKRSNGDLPLETYEISVMSGDILHIRAKCRDSTTTNKIIEASIYLKG